MKTAVVSGDGATISQHFGRASQYVVLTVVNGHVERRELRDKTGHVQFEGENDYESARDHY